MITKLTPLTLIWNQHRLDWYQPILTPFHHIPGDDFQTLIDGKHKALEFWLKVTSANNLDVYFETGNDWTKGDDPFCQCTCDRVLALAPLASWVDLFLDPDNFNFSLSLMAGRESLTTFVAVPKGISPTIYG